MSSAVNLQSTFNHGASSVQSKEEPILDDRKRRLMTAGLRFVVAGSLLHLVVGLVAMGTGVGVLVAASWEFKFPLSSGSGVWAGLVAFSCGMLGLISYSNGAMEDIFNPLRMKTAIAHYGMTITSLTTSGLHLGYSIWGQTVCNLQLNACMRAQTRETISTLEGVNVTLATLMLLTSVSLIILTAIFGRWTRWGRRGGTSCNM